MQKRLYRPEQGRQLNGVAVGLAEYFGVDVQLVRIAFVLATILGGPGILVYLALWIVMPSENDLYKQKNDMM